MENRTEEEIKFLRRTMGKLKNISCGIEFNLDYKAYPEYNHFNFVMTAAHAFNTGGVLPFSGALFEQPAQIMEILELIEMLDSERERDLMQKAEQDRKKNNGRR